MPTLVKVFVPRQPLDESDASETVLRDDNVDLMLGDQPRDDFEPLEEQGLSQPPRPLEDIAAGAVDGDPPRGDHDETFDASATILSIDLPCGEAMDERDEVAPSSGPRSQKQTTSQASSTSHREWRPNTAQHHHHRRNPQAHFMGPNKNIYRSKYETLVKSTIRDFDRKKPGKLRDYRSLPPEEQAKEQQRVLAVLSRLGIGKGSQKEPEHVASQCNARQRRSCSPSPRPIDRERLLNETLSPLMSPGCHGPPQFQLDEEHSFGMPDNDDDDDDSGMSQTMELEQSRILLSPVATQRDDLKPDEQESDIQNHSSESVELVRAAADSRSHCSSPGYGTPDGLKTTNPYKRQASTSAKRGADIYRTKYNEDVVPPRPDDASVSSGDGAMDEALSNRMERLSISPVDPGPKSFFAASQSPISPKLTFGSSDSSDEDNISIQGNKTSLRLGGMERTSRSRTCDDTIDTPTTTVDKKKRRAMRDIPVNVGMKKGATFHLEKLNVKRSELTILKNGIGEGTRRRLVNFPDPLTKYNTKQKKVLKDVFGLLCQSELDSKDQTIVETTSANVLFSLSYEQVMDLSLRLFLNDDDERSRYDRQDKSSVSMQGHTVIVTRTKDDVAMWERALREGTGCSVFNHAAAPLSERVRQNTAEKATKYDVVLTTYDALKSTDIAVPIDDHGYAIISKPQEDNGWMISRKASSQSESVRSQKCKQLCVLHKVNFQRVIFVDVLGRKSFLAKNGTARAAASIALRANSR